MKQIDAFERNRLAIQGHAGVDGARGFIRELHLVIEAHLLPDMVELRDQNLPDLIVSFGNLPVELIVLAVFRKQCHRELGVIRRKGDHA